MRRLAGIIVAAAVALGASAPAAARDWAPYTDKTMCRADFKDFALARWAIKGSKDVLGGGYAHSYVGLWVIVPNWVPIHDPEAEIPVDIALGGRQHRAAMRQIGPQMYFVMEKTGDWMRHLGSSSGFQLKLPPGQFRGYASPRFTYSKGEIAAAYDWWKGCRFAR